MDDMPDVLPIYCDEAGHTGPDLLNPEQRYFGFGSVSVENDESFEIIKRARANHPVQMAELKATNLMRSNRGRALIASVVRDVGDRFAVNVHEKLLALCGWIFEYVYEPVFKDDPRLLYQKNLHRFVAMYAWLWFKDQGANAAETIQQFQAYMRSMDESKAPLLFDRQDKNEREHPFDMIWQFAHGYRERIVADNADIGQHTPDAGRWTLDLSVSALWSHLNHWGQQGLPLRVACDASKPIQAFAGKLSGDQQDPAIVRAQLMRSGGNLGYALAEPVAFVDSRNHPSVQVADMIAGSLVFALNKGMPDDFDETIERIETGILRDSITPNYDIVDIKERGPAVNWLILSHLADKAKSKANPHALLAETYHEAEIAWARGDFAERFS